MSNNHYEVSTEPKVRVMIEGEDQNEIKTLAKDLAGIIREKPG